MLRIKGQASLVILRVVLVSLLFWALAGALYLQRIDHDALLRGLRERNELEVGRQELSESVQAALRDLRRLAEHPALLDMSAPPKPGQLQALQHSFEVLARITRDYDQLRLLGIEGRELLRVNWVGGRTELVSGDRLQNKAGRYYFSEAVDLLPGQVYVSPMDLNIEHGAIERPYKPTLRLAMPVFNARGERLGVVVLNYLGETLFRHFASVAPEIVDHTHLLNEDGYWLMADRPELTWGFMLAHGSRFATRHAEAWNIIRAGESGQFTGPEGLFTYATVRPLDARDPSDPGQQGSVSDSGYHWKLLSLLPAAQIAAADSAVFSEHLRIAVPAYLVVLLTALGYGRLRDGKRFAESALNASRSRQQSIIGHALDAIITLGRDGVVTELNPSARSLFEYDGQLRQQPLTVDRLVSPESQADLKQGLEQALDGSAGDRGRRLDLRMRSLNGTEFDAAVSVSPTSEVGGRATVSLFVRDVSEMRRAEQLLLDNQQRLEQQVAERTRELTEEISERKRAESKLRQAAKVFENTRDAIVITDERFRVQAANAAFTGITGFAESDLRGRRPWFFEADPDGINLPLHLSESGGWQGEMAGLRSDGSQIPVWMSISTVRNPYGRVTNYVAVFSDITEIKRSQARLDYMAHHDALTHLPNRVMFNSLLENAIVRARRAGHRFAVLFIDLDRFKRVNDSLGHEAGDELLRVVARRLRDVLREADTLARVGGDEFTVLLDAPQTRDEAGLVAGKLIAAVRPPVDLRGTQVYVGASVGISLYPDDGESLGALLRNADAAMFSAKQAGRDRYIYADAHRDGGDGERLNLETDLRDALRRMEFELYYQPQFRLADGRPVAVEALLRWRHPELGLLGPERFLDLAEETGLIHPLGDWVLRHACETFAVWQTKGLQAGRLTVNISSRQARNRELPGFVRTLMGRLGLAPGSLELDLPEQVLHPDAGFNPEHLLELRAAGAVLAIDNFGAHCAAIGQLHRMPVARLKLAQVLVEDMVGSAGAAPPPAAAFVALGHGLQMSVLGKGVETDAQLQALRDSGCDEAQGLLVGAPCAEAELLAELIRFEP